MATNLTKDHHLLTRNLKLNDNYISNDGEDEGISIADDGAVTIGTEQLTIDRDTALTATGTVKGLHIDYDHTGISASGQTITGIGLDLDMNCY